MKIFQGTVVSTKNQKTARVRVERIVSHPVYKKRMKLHKEYLVHDEDSVAKVGDSVKFTSSKPFSKMKKWALVYDKAEIKKAEIKKEVKPVTKKEEVKKVVKKAPLKKKEAKS